MALRGELPDGVDAVVLARWGDDRALVQRADGEAWAVAVPDLLRDQFDVGQHVTVAGDGAILSAIAPRGRARGVRRHV